MAPLTVMITSLFINLVNESFSKERRIHFTVPSFTQNKLPDPNANLHSLGREGPQTPIFPDFSLLIPPLACPVIGCTQTPQRHAFLRQDELSKLGYPLRPPQHHSTLSVLQPSNTAAASKWKAFHLLRADTEHFLPPTPPPPHLGEWAQGLDPTSLLPWCALHVPDCSRSPRTISGL